MFAKKLNVSKLLNAKPIPERKKNSFQGSVEYRRGDRTVWNDKNGCFVFGIVSSD